MFRKLFFPLFALVLLFGASGCSDEPGQDFDDVQNFTKLPQQAQALVNNYFSGNTITAVEIFGPASSPVGYEVEFANGTDIEFNSQGEWTDIDCGLGYTVPYALIPMGVLNFMDQNFPSANVVEIQRSVFGYTVEFSNDVEAVFDINGNFLRYD